MLHSRLRWFGRHSCFKVLHSRLRLFGKHSRLCRTAESYSFWAELLLRPSSRRRFDGQGTQNPTPKKTKNTPLPPAPCFRAITTTQGPTYRIVGAVILGQPLTCPTASKENFTKPLMETLIPFGCLSSKSSAFMTVNLLRIDSKPGWWISKNDDYIQALSLTFSPSSHILPKENRTKLYSHGFTIDNCISRKASFYTYTTASGLPKPISQ